jgi:hypothetical protein
LTVKGRLVPLLQRPEITEPGIDEQDVECAEGFLDAHGQLSLGRDIASVDKQHQNFGAERGPRRFDSGRVGAGDSDPCTFRDELPCRLEADTGGAAGDHRTLVFEPVHAGILQVTVSSGGRT